MNRINYYIMEIIEGDMSNYQHEMYLNFSDQEQNILIDVIWIISSLVAWIIAIFFYLDERFKLIVLMILCEIAFTMAIIKDIKSYRKTNKR